MSNACLNCGASLHGPFCSACGQRAVPRDPTVSELAGDAWHELSGYDGRIAATVRGLFRPGFLTHEYMAGRRARYVSPVRLYLIVSVIYFVVAAAAPNITTRPGELNMPVPIAVAVSTVVTLGFAAYAVVAARRVFGGGWWITIVKAVGVGAVYLVASLPAFALILVWAVLS